jgi:hypothetical protein
MGVYSLGQEDYANDACKKCAQRGQPVGQHLWNLCVDVVKEGKAGSSVELEPSDGYPEHFSSVSLGSPEVEKLQYLAFTLHPVQLKQLGAAEFRGTLKYSPRYLPIAAIFGYDDLEHDGVGPPIGESVCDMLPGP